MFEYKIQLKNKIEKCSNCPFCYKNIYHEDIKSENKLTGVTEVTRIQSFCILNDRPIFTDLYVYENKEYSECPLCGNVKEVIE